MVTYNNSRWCKEIKTAWLSETKISLLCKYVFFLRQFISVVTSYICVFDFVSESFGHELQYHIMIVYAFFCPISVCSSYDHIVTCMEVQLALSNIANIVLNNCPKK